MKAWSIKSKSVKDKIVGNEPKFQKDISFAHILKLNFIPVIFLIYSIIIIIIVLLFMN